MRNAPSIPAGMLEALNAARIAFWFGRLLLVLLAIELFSMPITQHLWRWDGFLHGGQDFELTLFLTISCLCLVLLRAHNYRKALSLLLAVFGLLPGAVAIRKERSARRSGSFRGNLPSGAGGAFLRPLPLRI